MRKLIFIFIFVLLSSVGWGQGTLIDGYVASNFDDYYSLYTGNATIVAQSFTNTNSMTLTSCKFDLAKYGSPTGNINCILYAHSGTYGTSSVPSGSALATSDNIDISTLTTSYVLTTFTFSGANQISLSATTYYIIAIQYPGPNSSNNLRVAQDGSSPSHSGNRARWNGSTWLASNLYDMIFYVYGTAGGGGGVAVKAINRVTQATLSKMNTVVSSSGINKINRVANK